MATREEQLKNAQSALQSGDFARGLSIAESIVAEDCSYSEAVYMAAVAARYLKQYDAAAKHLASLHQLTPEYGRAWQEEGHLALAQGDLVRAIDGFSRATRFNPALAASWRELARLLSNQGRHGEASTAQAQFDRISALPRELVAVTNHLHEGRLLRAEEICRHYLRSNPKDVEGMRLLARIGVELGILDDAEFLLESAVAFQPDNIQLRLDYIDVLRRRQKFDAALREAETLYSRDPDNPLFQSRLAIESLQTSDFDRAFELFDAVLKKLPTDPCSSTSQDPLGAS